MQKFSYIALNVLLLLLLQACMTPSNANQGSKTLSNIEDVKGLRMQFSRTSNSNLKNNFIRQTGLEEVAQSLGAQTALAWRAKQINATLEREARKLDNVFNFYSLLLPNSVLPPVLVEGNNSLELSGDTLLRVSDKTYQIMEQARFVTAPETWRNYLWMNFKDPKTPHNTMLPRTSEERKLWKAAVEEGWQRGLRQADSIFRANLANITLKYKGMVTYRKLLAQNMVTAPYVAKAELGVTGDGKRMDVNDKVLRITAMPELNTVSESWQPALSTKFKEFKKPRPQFSK